MKARIVKNSELTPGYFRMALSDVGPVAHGEPGQFVMVRGDWGTDPLLPRPFSAVRFTRESGGIEIIYRVVGRGTKRLSEMPEGRRIDLIGPLGRPFPRPDGNKRAILAAGAVGSAPLIALAESIVGDRLLIIGGKTRGDVTFIEEDVRRISLPTIYVTEDGSNGERGTAVSALSSRVAADDIVYACGPNKMLLEIARLTEEVGCEGFVSLEGRMACGIGVCLGCAVRDRKGEYLHVCKDGPVFDVKQIAWDQL